MSDPSPLVCIVDDDEAVRLSMAMSLRAGGRSVVEFESAQGFLDALPTLHPACLVLDLGMPVIDGREILEHLRRLGRNIPTVMVTGASALSLVERNRYPEIADCLEKPFRLSDLQARIDELLQTAPS